VEESVNCTAICDPGVARQGDVAALCGARRVPVERVIGRDLLEAERLLVMDPTLFARLPHLRELLLQRRGRTIVVVETRLDADGVATLLRFAGHVVAIGDGATPSWSSRLAVPVTCCERPGVADAIATALRAEVCDLDDVHALLREATNAVVRGDDEAAFLAAARALTRSPDQPGIVADVARLLARMGRSAEATHVCRSYLVQRPDCAAVRRALDDLPLAPA